MDLIAAIRIFTRVVETGSFSAVAREANSSQPNVSKAIAQLEQHLAARLFQRTTRKLTVTDEGQRFYDHAQRVLETVAEAEGAVGRRRVAPAGLLRMASPVVFGRLHVLPRLPRFLARYPEVQIDLVMNDGFTDLVGEGIDLALRVGEIDDPGLVARRVGVTRRVIVAAPDYVERRGRPQRPQDLTSHECVVYTRLASGDTWHFGGLEGEIAVRVSGRFRVNNSEGVRDAVLHGLGIGVVPIWLFRDEIAEGKVELLLTEFEPKRLPMNVVYPSRRFVSPRVRAMIDFLAEEFRLDPLVSDYGTEPR